MHAPPLERYQNVAAGIESADQRLSRTQFEAFWREGWLGPLRCTDPTLVDVTTRVCEAGTPNSVDGRPVPPRETWHAAEVDKFNVANPHLDAPAIHALAGHASIVNPVAQLLGAAQVEFFQSRYRVKLPGRPDVVPWHQDVGKTNGGLRDDGTPVQTLTVWLSLDGSLASAGALRVMPGTHADLFGNWPEGYASKLSQQEIRELDTTLAIPLEAAPGEFFVFHSGLLHLTTPNVSREPRSALALRYVAPEDAIRRDITYTTVRAR